MQSLCCQAEISSRLAELDREHRTEVERALRERSQRELRAKLEQMRQAGMTKDSKDSKSDSRAPMEDADDVSLPQSVYASQSPLIAAGEAGDGDVEAEAEAEAADGVDLKQPEDENGSDEASSELHTMLTSLAPGRQQ